MRKWFIAIVALQLCFVVAEAANYQLKLSGGDEIVLKVIPYDPRSLFMGHYMTLAYPITRADSLYGPNRLPAGTRLRDGQSVWLGLRPHHPYAQLVSVSLARPNREPGIVYMRGHYSGNQWGWSRVNYGIERYYIPENREAEVNSMWWNRNRAQPDVSASISVGRNGQAMVRRVYVNGKPLDY